MRKILFATIATLALGLVATPANAKDASPSATAVSAADAPATSTVDIKVETYTADGQLVSTQVIKGQPEPIGTPQSFSSRQLGKTAHNVIVYASGINVVPGAASGCRTLTITNNEDTMLGHLAYRFITENSWCWNVKKVVHQITDVDVVVRVANVDAFYKYDGLLGGSSVNQTLADGGRRIIRQGHFENCPAKYGCIGNYYPSNEAQIHPLGTWYWETNG